jgi:hypothetical protein
LICISAQLILAENCPRRKTLLLILFGRLEFVIGRGQSALHHLLTEKVRPLIYALFQSNSICDCRHIQSACVQKAKDLIMLSPLSRSSLRGKGNSCARNTMRNEKTDCERSAREYIYFLMDNEKPSANSSSIQTYDSYTQGDQLTQRQIKVTLIRFSLNR